MKSRIKNTPKLNEAFVAVLVLFSIVAAIALIFTLKNTSTEQRIKKTELETCQRFQIIKDRINATNAVGFSSYTNASKRERILAKAKSSAPSSVHVKSADKLEALADKLRYIEPVDCNIVVNDPGKFTPPKPVTFTPKLVKRALSIDAKVTKFPQ